MGELSTTVKDIFIESNEDNVIAGNLYNGFLINFCLFLGLETNKGIHIEGDLYVEEGDHDETEDDRKDSVDCLTKCIEEKKIFNEEENE